MLDAETKRRIDTARDILVGKVPDPKSQVEQITIALIYKFMDDMDAEAEEMGGARSFFAGEFEKYGWAKLMGAGLGGYEVLNLYAEAIARMNENPGIPALFRDIFKNAYLPYRDPETLRSFLKIINDFTYEHSERLGDAFEYLLSVLGSQGEAGQFRTPRHIIEFMVDLIDPQKGDAILDPACGTAGFLISAYKHILAANAQDGRPGARLAPSERARLIQAIRGYDISPDMVRLSLVNLYLHGFSDPHIVEYDTLTSDERWNEYADVIMANPPFMSPKGGIRPHKRFAIPSNRSEVLFVDYIAEHLTANGRAAVVVPEGVIFQTGAAYKKLRKLLVDAGYLVGVISLPAGVFNPYSGVKTSILWLDKTLAKKSDHILFVKIQADGFDLGAQRRPVKQNDLPAALQAMTDYKAHLMGGQPFEPDYYANVMLVERARVAENGEYNLSGERYRQARIGANVKYPFVEIGEICTFEYGKPLKQEDRVQGEYPVFGSNGIVGYHNEFLVQAPFLVVGRKGSAGEVHYSDKNGYPIDTTFYIRLENEDRIALKYLYHILKSPNLKGVNVQSGVPGLNRNDAYKVRIPLPPLDVQAQIVAEIEGYQKIIDGARQVVENYAPRIEINPAWPVVEIETVAAKEKNSIKAGPFGSSLRKEFYVEKGYKIYGQEQVIRGDASFGDYYIDQDKYDELISCRVQSGDVLISLVGTYGKTLIIPDDFEPGIINPRLMKVTLDRTLMIPRFFELIFHSDYCMSQVHNMSYGGTMSILNVTILRKLKVPLPDLATQERIVAQIEREQALVRANRELVALFEEKIKARIARVWGEEA